MTEVMKKLGGFLAMMVVLVPLAVSQTAPKKEAAADT
jgi:hypothetical protein